MEPATIKGVGAIAKGCLSLAKAVGPFFVSQFDYAKFKYLDFKTKQAQTAAYAEYFLAETRALVDIKAELLRDALGKSGLERVKAEENVKLLSKEINKLHTYSKVPAHILYLEQEKDAEAPPSAEEDAEISETWIDRFNELASKINEDWRQNLLAKSFAVEANKPGTIDLNTLLSIAQLDQRSFYFFEAILSASLKLYEVHFLPLEDHTKEITLDVNGTTHDIGNILYQLQHTGLLIYDERIGVILKPQIISQFRYHDDVLAAQSDTQRFFAGIMTTRSGNALAALCSTTAVEAGKNIFNSFEEKLRSQNSLLKRYSL